MRKLLLMTVSLAVLSACDLSPDFKLPEMFAPNAFKEDAAVEATVEPVTDGKWKRVDDAAKIEEFAWWRMFNDRTLDGLMEQAMTDNPSLEAALARVESARATAGNRDADLYPSIGVGIGPERTQQSPAAQEPNLPPGTPANVKPYTLYKAQGTITYELDLFGRNRNRAAAAWFDAASEEDNFRAARLSLQAELAQTYFRLAALRGEEEIVRKKLKTRDVALTLMRKKLDAGAIDALAISSAETDLASVQGDAAAVTQARSQAEHALAVLVGKPPSELSFEVAVLKDMPPTIPAGLPSALLERRPDIKRAVSAMKAANARIGVARTGYFPDISLSAMGGFVAGDISDLFKWSNRTWMIGPLAGTVITQPIFEGGKLAAARAQSSADFAAAVADYRASVLQAFREVEDQLSAVQSLAQQMRAAQSGRDAANRAFAVANDRYAVGYSSHLEYLDAKRSQLNAQRRAVQTRGEQFVATIQLVKALGGSWQAVPASVVEPSPTASAD